MNMHTNTTTQPLKSLVSLVILIDRYFIDPEGNVLNYWSLLFHIHFADVAICKCLKTCFADFLSEVNTFSTENTKDFSAQVLFCWVIGKKIKHKMSNNICTGIICWIQQIKSNCVFKCVYKDTHFHLENRQNMQFDQGQTKLFYSSVYIDTKRYTHTHTHTYTHTYTHRYNIFSILETIRMYCNYLFTVPLWLLQDLTTSFEYEALC